jgi:hydrogenase maturation protein HypF
MLPYTALHHILLCDLGFPIVATSGNLSDEPICFDEKEALSRLGGVADLFLVHDRPIERQVDDSVARVVLGRELVIRRARGYAPLPFRLKDPVRDLLAVGAHLKNAVAVARGTQVFLGPHVGDLDTAESREAFLGSIRTLADLQEIVPERVACDLHPDYVSTAHAESLGLPLVRVQHHHAHILACMAENEISGKALGVAWDGTGYGTDGSVWGGEFLLVAESGYRRVGSLRSFRLPGGEAAVREPRRSAFGLLYEMLGEGVLEREDLPPVRDFTSGERTLLARMLARGTLSPLTTSAGRLFDAVASILGIRQRMSFEGQAAMELEYSLPRVPPEEAYPFRLAESDDRLLVDWEPIVRAILEDAASGRETGEISARFHNALAEGITAAARAIGEEAVVLSGGCWQNAYLLTRTVRLLRASGHRPYWHQRVPPNDGGIALGQAAAALGAVREER